MLNKALHVTKSSLNPSLKMKKSLKYIYRSNRATTQFYADIFFINYHNSDLYVTISGQLFSIGKLLEMLVTLIPM